MPTLGLTGLSSDNIANRALSVAESTRTTGHCYAAVGRALRPLGVSLTGEAAYQAKAILLEDPRFAALTIYDVDQLRRGDIVVYTRSSSHPYGHISVYEGNNEEASDHVAAITHTQAYGSATVFRLRRDNFAPVAAIVAAPDYHTAYANMSGLDHQTNTAASLAYGPAAYASTAAAAHAPNAAAYAPAAAAYRSSPLVSHHLLKGIFSSIRRDYSTVAGEPIEHSLLRKCARFLLR